MRGSTQSEPQPDSHLRIGRPGKEQGRAHYECGSSLEIDDANISFFDLGGVMKQMRHLLYFWLLNRSDQATAIRRLANSGMDIDTIVEVSGLNIEQVCKALAADLVPA